MSRGLLMVNTGKGKGKTTAALGQAMRFIGHEGHQAACIQFIKGKWPTGEEHLPQAFGDRFYLFRQGKGFTWDRQNPENDRRLAEDTWEKAKSALFSGKYGMVIWDEINIVLRYNYLNVNDVLDAIKDKDPSVHLILTGRDCPEEILAIADQVTDMGDVKHPYREGIKAQKGIEY
jgi:cob(I)alamin adenosyltransferase